VREGDCFRVTVATKSLDDHIFITISDPTQNANRVIAANFTTWHSWKDQSCIVLPREYSELYDKTCINYGDQGKLLEISVAQYDGYIRSNKIRSLRPLDPVILERIRGGRTRTEEMSGDVRAFLRAQGLVPPTAS
jgi:hypothetical protein